MSARLRNTVRGAGLVCLWLLAGAHACTASRQPRPHAPACSGASCEEAGVAPDADSAAEAGAGHDAARFDSAAGFDAGDAADAALPPLAACTLEPPRVPFASPVVVSTLSSLCEALDELSIARCPADRAAYLLSLEPECEPGGTFPLFDRRCGVDIVYVGADSAEVRWYFDAATGALIAADLVDYRRSLPCGAAIYRGGPEIGDCASSDGACSLCVAEPDDCPADISAAIPSAPCAAAADPAPSCLCGDDSPTEVDFSVRGATCGAADQCEHCSFGTCWADCRCLRSGVRRYVVGCTE